MKAKVVVITKEVYDGTCHRLSLGNIVYVIDDPVEDVYYEVLLDSNKIILSSRIIPKSHCELVRVIELEVRSELKMVHTLIESPIKVKKYKILCQSGEMFFITDQYYCSIDEFNRCKYNDYCRTKADCDKLAPLYLIKESEKEFD